MVCALELGEAVFVGLACNMNMNELFNFFEAQFLHLSHGGNNKTYRAMRNK